MKCSTARVLIIYCGSLTHPHDLLELMQAKETGQPSTGCEGIQTRETTFQLMDALADSHSAPAEFPFCAPLSAWPQFFDCPGHKEPAGATLEGSSCFHEQCLEGIGELHTGTSSKWLSGVYYTIWDNLILESP